MIGVETAAESPCGRCCLCGGLHFDRLSRHAHPPGSNRSASRFRAADASIDSGRQTNNLTAGLHAIRQQIHHRRPPSGNSPAALRLPALDAAAPRKGSHAFSNFIRRRPFGCKTAARDIGLLTPSRRAPDIIASSSNALSHLPRPPR